MSFSQLEMLEAENTKLREEITDLRFALHNIGDVYDDLYGEIFTSLLAFKQRIDKSIARTR